MAWDAYILDSVLLTSAWLEDITILVLYGKGHHGPLLSSEQTALQTGWPAEEGLYFGWDADYSTCPMVDSLPSARHQLRSSLQRLERLDGLCGQPPRDRRHRG